MHPEKTKIVYCNDDNRKGNYPNVKFDFLGFGFQPRSVKNKRGELFVSFSPAISDKASKSIRDKIRECKTLQGTSSELSNIAKELNPKLRGWINYYGKFYKSKLDITLKALKFRLTCWVRKKYKKLRRSFMSAIEWIEKVLKSQPKLFVH